MTYLIDTNILSEPIKKTPNGKVLERLTQHAEQIVTTHVVWHEMLFGAFRLPASKKRRAIEAYLFEDVSAIPLFPYDDRAARYHAEERVRLEKIGGKRGETEFADGIIAAVAMVNNLIVVTANVKPFKIFRGLRVENWA